MPCTQDKSKVSHVYTVCVNFYVFTNSCNTGSVRASINCRPPLSNTCLRPPLKVDFVGSVQIQIKI